MPSANPAGPQAPLPQQPTTNASPGSPSHPIQIQNNPNPPKVVSQPKQPVVVQNPTAATSSAVQAAITWLTKLVQQTTALEQYMQTVANNIAKETPAWSVDAENLGQTATTLKSEQSSTSWIDPDLLETVTNGQQDILTAMLLTGQASQGASMVTDASTGLASLDIPSQAAAISALLAQLGTTTAPVVAAAPAPGTVKASTAVVAGVGGVAAGGLLGGLLGHAIGSGAIARESGEMAAEKKRRKKKSRR